MISCVDDATTREVVLLDEVNHAGIGMVGVNADVAALCWAPVEYGAEDSSSLSIGGNAMNGAVR